MTKLEQFEITSEVWKLRITHLNSDTRTHLWTSLAFWSWVLCLPRPLPWLSCFSSSSRWSAAVLPRLLPSSSCHSYMPSSSLSHSYFLSLLALLLSTYKQYGRLGWRRQGDLGIKGENGFLSFSNQLGLFGWGVGRSKGELGRVSTPVYSCLEVRKGG